MSATTKYGLLMICIFVLIIIFATLNNNIRKEVADNYKIRVIDGCEYIEYSAPIGQRSETLTHKGNCKNPIHIYNSTK